MKAHFRIFLLAIERTRRRLASTISFLALARLALLLHHMTTCGNSRISSRSRRPLMDVGRKGPCCDPVSAGKEAFSSPWRELERGLLNTYC